MLIDWFTVGAQATNFLILVWLLKRFLYKPVQGAIDAREKRIASELANAEAGKAEAQRQSDDLRGRNRAFDEQRDALMAKVADDAKAERERLVAAARKEADGLRSTQEAALQRDRKRLGDEIRRTAALEVLAVARRALLDLASVSLEERMAEVFARRLRALGGTDKESMRGTLTSSPDPAVVRTTFDLPADQRAAIQNALNETFSAEIRVRFETAPEAVSGIEMTCQDQSLSWSVAGYLGSLESRLGALMGSHEPPAVQATANPGAGTALPPISLAHAVK
jgi:F-type H+-transporting ATPase subunit b